MAPISVSFFFFFFFFSPHLQAVNPIWSSLEPDPGLAPALTTPFFQFALVSQGLSFFVRPGRVIALCVLLYNDRLDVLSPRLIFFFCFFCFFSVLEIFLSSSDLKVTSLQT